MLHYEITDRDPGKEWIIMLHGLGGSSRIWYKQLEEYKKHFNVVLIDFFGHGQTAAVLDSYTFEILAQEVFKVMDETGLTSAHVAGISLGTIIANYMCLLAPERIDSLILGGAVLDFDLKTRFLLHLGSVLKYIMPYMWLYSLFAFIIMPRKNHTKSRQIFVREARKLGHKEFIKWYKLMQHFPQIAPRFKLNAQSNVPKFFITGSQDHLFVNQVKGYINLDPQATLYLIDSCGHVCNVERSEEFNRVSISYILGLAKYNIPEEQQIANRVSAGLTRKAAHAS